MLGQASIMAINYTAGVKCGFRYVRVESLDTNHFAEMFVMRDGENIAQGKTAVQDTNFNANTGPEKCNDNKIDYIEPYSMCATALQTPSNR